LILKINKSANKKIFRIFFVQATYNIMWPRFTKAYGNWKHKNQKFDKKIKKEYNRNVVKRRIYDFYE